MSITDSEPKATAVGGPGGTALRVAATVVLVGLLAAAVWFLFGTRAGASALQNPRQFAADVRQVVGDHPADAAGVYLAVYVAFGVLCLPVWWLQLSAGVAFGLWVGGGLTLVGSAVAASITAAVADWLAGDWFHRKVEGKMARLRSLDETLGHNGLLVVMSVRLVHVLPFGLCNIALGLSRVTAREVFVGTFLGNVPAVAFYVGSGAGYHPWTNWRFLGAIGLVNLVLLIPLALRYWRPEWFRKIGVE